jgi:hypothetical protein
MRYSKHIHTLIAGALTLATGVATAAPVQTLLLTGRVEFVNSSEGVVQVLGRKIYSNDARRVVLGQLINVYGISSADGSINKAQLESVANYVVGDATAYVDGFVTSVDSAAGVVYVGSTPVPISQLATAQLPKPGDQVSVFGTQSAQGGEIVVRRAILSGSGDREQILSGSGDKGQILSGSGDKGQILSGSGDRGQILSGSGDKGQILSGSGDKGQILSGSGDKGQILSGSGDRGQILSGSGDKGQILSGSGDRSQILSGSGDKEQILSGSGDRAQILSGSGFAERASILSGSGDSSN